jgi:hypothetical protein
MYAECANYTVTVYIQLQRSMHRRAGSKMGSQLYSKQLPAVVQVIPIIGSGKGCEVDQRTS